MNANIVELAPSISGLVLIWGLIWIFFKKKV